MTGGFYSRSPDAPQSAGSSQHKQCIVLDVLADFVSASGGSGGAGNEASKKVAGHDQVDSCSARCDAILIFNKSEFLAESS